MCECRGRYDLAGKRLTQTNPAGLSIVNGAGTVKGEQSRKQRPRTGAKQGPGSYSGPCSKRRLLLDYYRGRIYS
jgi:hypothetical protein